MLTTAEVRWFWPARCPQLVRDWFFKTGLPPGGGLSRVDRYAATALAHHQPLFLVEPVELLAIELDALAFQHQTKTTIAEPPPLGRQLSQLPAKPFIERPL